MAKNISAIISILNIVSGFNQLQEIMSAIEIMNLKQKTYQNEYDHV
jgi:hypothetical protein